MLTGWYAGLDDHWQAHLWRELRSLIGHAGPAERLEAACRELAVDPELTSLPPRLALFGLSTVPASHLEILRALVDGGREVHLFLLQPSSVAWANVAGALYRYDAPVARHAVGTAFLPENPLSASWGREGRELQIVLARTPTEVRDIDHATKGDNNTDSLLTRLQADVRADRAPIAQASVDADGTVQVHACHGAGRQVEVLREAILHSLQADPTLEPRDVIVMCPDIETFAPLIQATFGAGEPDEPDDPAMSRGPAAELRVRLADRSLRKTNPILAVVARALELATARVTASEILDLADREPSGAASALRNATTRAGWRSSGSPRSACAGRIGRRP